MHKVCVDQDTLFSWLDNERRGKQGCLGAVVSWVQGDFRLDRTSGRERKESIRGVSCWGKQRNMEAFVRSVSRARWCVGMRRGERATG